MLIARLAPVETNRYKVLSRWVEKLDPLMTYKPTHWFAIWVLTISGMSAYESHLNPTTYMQMSNATMGILVLLVVTSILAFLTRKEWLILHPSSLTVRSITQFIVLSAILYLIGWGVLNGDYGQALVSSFPYLLAFLAAFIVHGIQLDSEGTLSEESSGETSHFPVHRKIYLGIAFGLISLAVFIGYRNQDPVISTAAMVYWPFLLVALLMPAHDRHLQRARIYAIFILSFFLWVRLTWVFFLMVVLFFLLRFYHYFRYQTVYPTFGVSHD